MTGIGCMRLACRALPAMLAAFCSWETAAPCAAQTAEEPAVHRLKQGDRVAFFGDSITAQDLYTTFVANHYTAFRPEMKLEFRNAGVGGDRLAEGIARIDRDLVPFKPTVITCCFGMNDAGYVAPDDPKAAENLDKYKEDYARMIGLLRQKCPGARIVLFTTTASAPVNQNLARYNELLGRFSAFVRDLGREQKLQVVELHAPMVKWVEGDGRGVRRLDLIPDGVHPNAAGHFLVAELILEQWGEAAVSKR